MSTIAHRIRIARTEAGLSQEGLARQLNVTGKTIYEWERGQLDRMVAEIQARLTLVASATGADLKKLAGQ